MNVAEGDGENEDEMYDVMQQHADAMEYVQKWFVWLTVVYAVIVLFLLVKPLRSWKFVLPVNLAFLVALAYANLLMASGAHLGGRLVHQYGVKSALAPEAGTQAAEGEEEAMAEEAQEDPTATEEDATAAEAEKDAPAPDAEKETPAADEMQEEPAPADAKEAPVAEPKPDAPAGEAEKEAPAPEPAKDGAAKDAPQL